MMSACPVHRARDTELISPMCPGGGGIRTTTLTTTDTAVGGRGASACARSAPPPVPGRRFSSVGIWAAAHRRQRRQRYRRDERRKRSQRFYSAYRAVADRASRVRTDFRRGREQEREREREKTTRRDGIRDVEKKIAVIPAFISRYSSA